MSKRVYGIDLGTTYSCIAYVDEFGKSVVANNSENSSTTPSVVWFESAANIVVGETAKEMTLVHQDRVVSTIKRQMGNAEYVYTVDGKDYRPQEISAQILRKVVSDAAAITGDTIEDVVITCPAYFGLPQKEATQQAGVIAGLNVLYVIPEPTAAAIAYGLSQAEDQNVLVYDLGGGTFDITLISITPDALTVIATGGDDQLGGKDWDDDIVAYLASEFAAQTGIPASELSNDLESYQQLLNDSEKIKFRLSSAQSVTQRVRIGANEAKIDLTREKFEELTRARLERTVSLTEEMIERGKSMGVNRIDSLLLVGGSTYMPQVIERMKRQFPYDVKQFDPNQAVAKGAALFGYRCALEQQIKIVLAERTGQSADSIDLERISPELKEGAQAVVAAETGLGIAAVKKLVDRKITNVASKSFGIVVIDDDTTRHESVNNLVCVDDQVPREVTRQYFTVDADQADIELRVMENTGRDPNLNVQLAECEPQHPIGVAVLTFARPLPKTSPVEVTFRLSPDGRLSLHAHDLTTGREIDAVFQTKAIMSKEELQQAKSRALSMSVS